MVSASGQPPLHATGEQPPEATDAVVIKKSDRVGDCDATSTEVRGAPTTSIRHKEDRNETTRKDSEEDVEDEFERRFNDRFLSIRSRTGLEIGVSVSWPGIHVNSNRWELSTCLSSDCIAPFFHGTQWAGTRVWRAAVVALEYLLADEAELRVGSDHAVIELGCGLGVPGMVLHALRKCTVVLTDMGDLIPTVQENLNKAFPGLDSDTERLVAPHTILARELDWSAKGVNKLIEETGLTSIDVVLCCDCIFEPLYGDSWKQLLQCQVSLMRANPRAYVLTSVERRNFDGISDYLRALTYVGVAIKPICPTSFAYPPQVELYRLCMAEHSPQDKSNRDL